MKPNPAPSFDAWMSQGLAASQAGDSAQAIECFQQAAAASPDAGLPQFLLGAEFAARGDIAQAETAYANATRLAPGLAMARYQLGQLQFSTGRAAEKGRSRRRASAASGGTIRSGNARPASSS